MVGEGGKRCLTTILGWEDETDADAIYGMERMALRHGQRSRAGGIGRKDQERKAKSTRR